MKITFRRLPRALGMLGALAVCLGSVAAQAAEFYAAPNGSSTGSGSKTSPLDLVTALSRNSPVRAGDTLWLNSGRYPGNFNSHLNGSSTKPILVRQAPDARATIDGSLVVYGQWAHYWGFEVTNSNPDRTTPRPTGVSVATSNVKLINLVIHDTGQGIITGSDFVNVNIYGCIIYRNGWIGTDRPHGHAVYIQNRIGSKTVADNVIFEGYAYGIHAYGEQGYVNNLRFDGNIIYNNGMTNFHVGGINLPSENITVTRNFLYSTRTTTHFVLGYSAKDNRGLVFTRNTLINGAAQFRNWKSDVQFQYNTLYSTGRLITFMPNNMAQTPLYPPLSWEQNTYFASNNPTPFATDGLASYTFSNWKQTTGYDGHSHLDTTLQAPEQFITVRPNRYESGRGYVAIYNRVGAATASLDLRSIMAAGMRYQILPIGDVYGQPVATGVYDGQPVTIPLNMSSTGLEFNTFLVKAAFDLGTPSDKKGR